MSWFTNWFLEVCNLKPFCYMTQLLPTCFSLQQEFGCYSTRNSRKKASTASRKHLQKILPTEDGEKKLQAMRRKINSETFDVAFFGGTAGPGGGGVGHGDLQSKSSLLTGIYSPSKTRNDQARNVTPKSILRAVSRWGLTTSRELQFRVAAKMWISMSAFPKYGCKDFRKLRV